MNHDNPGMFPAGDLDGAPAPRTLFVLAPDGRAAGVGRAVLAGLGLLAADDPRPGPEPRTTVLIGRPDVEALTDRPGTRALVVFRDPAAMAAEVADRDGSDVFAALDAALAVQEALVEVVLQAPLPILAVSFEKARGHVAALAESAARLAGLAPRPEHVAMVLGAMDRLAAGRRPNGPPVGRGA